MYTECPGCRTAFQITAEMLQQAAGNVRCGDCGRAFNALENLSEDLTLAARNALIEMVDYVSSEYGLTPEQAYVVCSVAADLRIGQVVDVPNYLVSMILPKEIFQASGQTSRQKPGQVQTTVTVPKSAAPLGTSL